MRLLTLSLAALSILITTGAANPAQLPFLSPSDADFTPVSHLSHPHYPGHRIRIRRSTSCEERNDLDSFSGYLDAPATLGDREGLLKGGDGKERHFYFSFFASRNDAVNDPVTLWINGGPGCASSCGLYQELGPCQITEPKDRHSPPGVVNNPFSWTTNSSMLFLDQPTGVGFSYSESRKDRGVYRTEQAAVDVHAFFTIFFHAFRDTYGKKYVSRSFILISFEY